MVKLFIDQKKDCEENETRYEKGMMDMVSHRMSIPYTWMCKRYGGLCMSWKCLDERREIKIEEDKMEYSETTAEDVYSVFRTIIAQQLPRTRAFELAHAYARVGLELSADHLRTHVLYLLANLQEWRGVEARECKRILGNFISKA